MECLQNRRDKIVVAAVFFIAFFLGIETGGLQYSVLKMAEEFHLTSAQMGSIVSVYFFATMLSPIFTGALSDKIGKKKIIIAAIAAFLIGCLISSSANTMKVLYTGIFVVGMSFSAIESSATAALSDYHPEKSGKFISIMQSIFSAGCFVAPVVLYFLMDDMCFDWRVLFYLCMLLAIISLIFVLIANFKKNVTATIENEHGSKSAGIRTEAYLIVMVLCISIYQFTENGITFFADLFISVEMGDPDAAALAISLFWVAMAISRFVTGFLYKYENFIIKSGFVFTAVLLMILSFADNVTVSLGIYLALGIVCGPIWPLITGKVNREYKEHTGLVTGMVLIAGGIGGTVSPYVIGSINDLSNMAVAFISLAVFAVTGMIVFTMIQARKRRHIR